MSIQFDHRILSDEMEIFFINEDIGAGLPVWLPNGVVIRDELEAFVKERERRAGYQRVVSPHLGKSVLYEKSGHLQSFKEDMYPPIQREDENSVYYLKPMNCPHHHKVFAALPRSYRQLPLRLAEYGQVYRFENSGSLRGLSRARSLCQNDAHIYIDPAGALNEIIDVLDLHEACYRALGLRGHRYRLSLSDPNRPEVFEPSPEWKIAEGLLREALQKRELPFFEAVGEAAFYGPKIDVQMQMSSGQEESIASVQLDFFSADRFDLAFIAKSGQAQRPWIIHRAPLGSHERFVALLLEYYQGRLPGWLSPIQLMIVPISQRAEDEAARWAHELRMEGLRAQVDQSGGSLAKRLRFAHRSRPFAILVAGDKELESKCYKLKLRDQEIQGEREAVISELKALIQKPDGF